MRIKARYLLLILLLPACNQQQSTSDRFASAVKNLGESVNQSQRDGVIKNWQNKVADSASCADYKSRFKAAGERYESAANAAFVSDMMKVWEAAKAANCQYVP